VLRPPVANDRLTFTSDHKVRIALKRDFSDGTFAIDLDPLALLFRLAATVPAPRFHTVRYAGVLASSASLRPRIIPPPTPPADTASRPTMPPPPSGGPRSVFRKWAELLRLTFAIDVETCPRCGGRMKLVALVNDPNSVRRFLGHLGLPAEPPPLGPARGPPFARSPERRLRPSPQAEMFDEG
jgi:Putative transposase